MSIIIPPELDRMMRSLSDRTRVQRDVGRVVADSRPAARKPPRYGSLVSTAVTADPSGFEAKSSGELAAGAEFGGRRRPPQTYLTRSRKGKTYAVRRRTTMQFLPHNSRGYALVPAMRSSMGGIRARITEAIVKAVTG